jgi:hypothetical protein
VGGSQQKRAKGVKKKKLNKLVRFFLYVLNGKVSPAEKGRKRKVDHNLSIFRI